MGTGVNGANVGVSQGRAPARKGIPGFRGKKQRPPVSRHVSRCGRTAWRDGSGDWGVSGVGRSAAAAAAAGREEGGWYVGCF